MELKNYQKIILFSNFEEDTMMLRNLSLNKAHSMYEHTPTCLLYLDRYRLCT